jgi:hypothetical protein
MGEIDRKAGGSQSHADDPRHGRVVVAEQHAPGRHAHVNIYFAAGAFIPSRQIDMKNRPASGRIIEPDLAAEPLDDLLDNAQPEARAALSPRIGSVGLGEFLEDVRPELG